MRKGVSIVLVEPENPDNIGAVARAMKNMGLNDLRLVGPPEDWQPKAKKMAMSAWDVVKGASTYPTLDKAVADASLVIGTSRRKGAKRGVFIPLPEAIRKVKGVSVKKKAAIVFGKESKGLDNRSLRVCDWITTIPASPEYPSLNLAQAVMIMGFSLFREKKTSPENHFPVQPNYVSKAVIQDVLNRWRKALLVLRYDREGGKDVIDCILMTFHGIFKRAGLVNSESQMLRGIARRIGERLGE